MAPHRFTGSLTLWEKAQPKSFGSWSICIEFCVLQHELSCLCAYPNLNGYRIKTHGLLVLVSYVHCCSSTPSLSTSWSRTTLQVGQAPGISYLRTIFSHSCLQPLSLPHITTLQCHWR